MTEIATVKTERTTLHLYSSTECNVFLSRPTVGGKEDGSLRVMLKLKDDGAGEKFECLLTQLAATDLGVKLIQAANLCDYKNQRE